MKPIEGTHPYLEKERRIPADVFCNSRFVGRIRIDSYQNAIFPHWNQDGLCGYEIKNRNFTGFAPGGEKGLWGSRISPDDTTLVIAETAIDALSYFVLKDSPRATLHQNCSPSQPHPAQIDFIGNEQTAAPGRNYSGLRQRQWRGAVRYQNFA